MRKQKKKGRRKGTGSRKGKKGSRTPRKKAWVKKVRILRKTLKAMKNKGKVDKTRYRELYRKISGGFFRNKKHLRMYIARIGAEDVKEKT